MRIGLLLIVFASLFLGGCAGTQTIPDPESPGARLFQERCTMCHGLPAPTRHNPEQWDHLLVMMEGFMQERNIDFPVQEKKLIRDYLHKNAN
ncbi:MAG: cytochrome c [Nitrospinae bacterium]|nr:cytochrome c [Nitrospinota bacterium]MZH42452.1 cytochrome c [Nitrospinota bacterium]